MISKTKLKKFRLIRGFTQEELSVASGISIRTIQRIEKGVSEGSPFTLRSLSKALEVEHSEITNLIDYERNDFIVDLGDVKLLNLSSLSLLILPFGNLILPLILFVSGKGKDPSLRNYTNKIFSYQIIWSLVTLVAMILLPLVLFAVFDLIKGNSIPLFIPVYFLAGFVNIWIIIQTAINLNKQKEILDFTPNLL